MRALFLVAIALFAVFPARADVGSDFKATVGALERRFGEIDQKASALISSSKAGSFTELAELRNELVRYVGDLRRNIEQSRKLADQNQSLRLQAEADLKSLLENNIDTTDDDGQPIAPGGLGPKIDARLSEIVKNMDDERSAYSTKSSERQAKVTASRAPETTQEQKIALQTEIRIISEELSNLRNALSASKSARDQLRRGKDSLAKVIEYSNFTTEFRPQIERIERLDTLSSQKMQQIDEAIFNKLLIESNDQRYTLYSTMVFGIAVVIVICAFFLVAYKSEAVRASIFANDSGLQFVTLFSLVIAIILFGVLKILEGKELAALLGGLSGYILGRGGISRQANVPIHPAPDVPGAAADGGAKAPGT